MKPIISEKNVPALVTESFLPDSNGAAYAEAVLDLMSRPERRQAALDQACRNPWAASVEGFLAAHINVSSAALPRW